MGVEVAEVEAVAAAICTAVCSVVGASCVDMACQRAGPGAVGHEYVEDNAAAWKAIVQEYGGKGNMKSRQWSAVLPEVPLHFLSFAKACEDAGAGVEQTD